LLGILGEDNFNKPGFTAAALILGDVLSRWALIIGPETSIRSNYDTEVSYDPGPTIDC
jgi:hypothetical protein